MKNVCIKNTLIKKIIKHNMRGIKSKHHEIYIYKSDKTSLSAFNDKRYILDDGINTLHMGINIYLNKIK